MKQSTLEPVAACHAALDGGRTLDPVLCDAAIDRILDSRYFAKAQLLSSFLRFVWQRSLAQDAPRVTEQEIGVKVFRRQPGYDPGEDNIVRNYARQLRRRIEEYYTHEGQKETLRLEMPRGGYVPVFVEAPVHPPGISRPEGIHATLVAPLSPEPGPAPSSPSREQDSPVRSGSLAAWRLWLWGLTAIVLVAASGWAVTHFHPRFAGLPPLDNDSAGAIWREVFRHGQNTYMVPADTGFVMIQEMSRRTFSLAEYETWPGVEQFDHIYTSYLKAQQYTSVLDLRIISQIERRPEAEPARFIVCSARNLKVENLNEGNAVLLGSIFSNPWVAVVEPQLNFRFVYDLSSNRSWIRNLHPQNGEQTLYSADWNSYSHGTFAVLALVPNLNKTGHILLIQGLDGAGTEAATEMLFSVNGLRPIVAAARRSDGSLRGFEVLLQATSLESHATDSRIIAYRILE
jgi:hypothetical protein